MSNISLEIQLAYVMSNDEKAFPAVISRGGWIVTVWPLCFTHLSMTQAYHIAVLTPFHLLMYQG